MSPVYEYICPDDHEFERLLPFSAIDKKQKCPHREDFGGGEVVLCGLIGQRFEVPSSPASFRIGGAK